MRNIDVLGCFLLFLCIARAYRQGNCRYASYERSHDESHEDEDDLQVEASMVKTAPMVQSNKEQEEDEGLDSYEGWQGGKVYQGSWWDGWARGWHASVKKQALKNKKQADPKGSIKSEGQMAESQSKGRAYKDYMKNSKKVVPHGNKIYGHYGHYGYGGYKYPSPYYYGKLGYRPAPYGGYRPPVSYYGAYGSRMPYYSNYARPYVNHHSLYGHRYGSYGPMYRSPYAHPYRG